MIRVNPSILQAKIELALEHDPAANGAEYLFEWRADAEGFISGNILEACVLNAQVSTREVQ